MENISSMTGKKNDRISIGLFDKQLWQSGQYLSHKSEIEIVPEVEMASKQFDFIRIADKAVTFQNERANFVEFDIQTDETTIGYDSNYNAGKWLWNYSIVYDFEYLKTK